MNALINIGNKNLIEWSHMEDWVNGTSSAPTEHTLSGASATVARESTIVKRGSYSAAVARVGADATLYHDFPDYADYQGRNMTFGAWVYATVASRARLSIGDGVGTTNSSYHTGDSTWQFLTVTRDIDVAATRIRCGMEVNTGNTTAYFDSGMLVEAATVLTDLSSYLEDWKHGKKYRMSRFTVARRPGLIIPSAEHDSLSLKMNGRIFGTTATAARTSFDAMMQALNGSEKDLYLYDDRLMRVHLEAINHDYIAALRCIKFDLSFVAQVPFQQSVQRYRSQQSISSSPTSFTVTNAGSVFTKPRITFVAGGSNISACTIENLTNGQIWTFNGTVLAGDTMVADFEKVTLTNDGVDSIGNSVGDFPQFRLEPGDNLLKFTGSNCTIKVDWFDRWVA